MHDQKELAVRAQDILMRTVQSMGPEFNEVNVGLAVAQLEAEAANLVHSVLGPRSSYAESLRTAMKAKKGHDRLLGVVGVLQALQRDFEAGNLLNVRHQIEAAVVSEILEQAKKLHQTKGIHPAAVLVVACAAVEEFLRNWCESRGITVPKKQRSLGRFALELRKSEAIRLPDERRIQSWADYRNDAAHGNWTTVSKQDAARVIAEIDSFIHEHEEILG